MRRSSRICAICCEEKTMLARMLDGTLGQAQRFRRDEGGATAIEYTLIAGFIGLAIVVGATAVGTKLNGFFTTLAGNW
jgi:pilus assembly protein Flp/PilA